VKFDDLLSCLSSRFVANLVGSDEAAEKLPFEVLEKQFPARLHFMLRLGHSKVMSKSAWSGKKESSPRNVVKAGVGREGWDDEGLGRVRVHRVRHRWFADDTGKCSRS